MKKMNSNIEVIGENLWAVNFEYVKNDYIQELSFSNMQSTDRLAVLTDDGIIVLNKAFDYSTYVPFLQAVMTLNKAELVTKQGFCKVIRILIPKIKDWDDKKILNFIWSDSSITENWTIYQNLCRWESERRKTEKNWKKQHPVKALFKKIRKGVK